MQTSLETSGLRHLGSRGGAGWLCDGQPRLPCQISKEVRTEARRMRLSYPIKGLDPVFI